MVSKQDILKVAYRKWKTAKDRNSYFECLGIVKLASSLIGFQQSELLEQIFNDAYLADDEEYKKLIDSLNEEYKKLIDSLKED